MRFFALFLLLSSLACATVPVPPHEQLARTFTQAYLRRSVPEMKQLAVESLVLPTPNFSFDRDKIVRVCTPPLVKTSALQYLVLFGNPQALSFFGMLVSVAQPDSAWRVIDAQLAMSPKGTLMPYSRGCQASSVPTGSGGAY